MMNLKLMKIWKKKLKTNVTKIHVTMKFSNACKNVKKLFVPIILVSEPML